MPFCWVSPAHERTVKAREILRSGAGAQGAHPDRHESDQGMQDRDRAGPFLGWGLGDSQGRDGEGGRGSRDLPALQKTNNTPPP